MGIYRQKKRAAEGSVSTAGPSPNQPTERPDQLRQKFAQSLKVGLLRTRQFDSTQARRTSWSSEEVLCIRMSRAMTLQAYLKYWLTSTVDPGHICNMMGYLGKPSSRKDTRKDPRRRYGTPKARANGTRNAVPSLLEIRNTYCWLPTPQAEIKGKDKALLKEIAALEEDEADQVKRERESQSHLE